MEAKKLNEVSESQQVTCISPAKAWLPTQTEAEHEAVVESKMQQANALEEGEVRRPDRPISTVLEEGFTFVRSARKVSPELHRIGLRGDAIDEYESLLFALMSSHVLTGGVHPNQRSEAGQKTVTEGREVFAEVGAATRLVLRNTAVAARVAVLSSTVEAELVPNMIELTKIVRAAERAFTEKGFDARQLADELAEGAATVRGALADEETQRHLSDRYDLRDRFYTLAMLSLDEIRAHAEYAFRNDGNGHRRELFTSAYGRARNRRYQSKKKAGTDPQVAEPGNEDGAEEK